jgi:hypothetical protein
MDRRPREIPLCRDEHHVDFHSPWHDCNDWGVKVLYLFSNRKVFPTSHASTDYLINQIDLLDAYLRTYETPVRKISAAPEGKLKPKFLSASEKVRIQPRQGTRPPGSSFEFRHDIFETELGREEREVVELGRGG